MAQQMRAKMRFVIMVGIGLLMLASFQNCTSNPSLTALTSGSQSASASGGGTGNGSGYDGKAYVVAAIGGECGSDAIKAQITVRNSDQHAYLVKQNCQVLAQAQDVTSSILSLVPSPTTGVLVYNNQVFTYTPNPASTSQQLAVVHCQKMTSATQGITLDITSTGTGTDSGTAYTWNPGANPEFTPIASDSSIMSSTMSGASPVYVGMTITLSLTVDASNPAAYIGQMTVGATYYSGLNCYVNN